MTGETVFDWYRDGRTVTLDDNGTIRVRGPAGADRSVTLRGGVAKALGRDVGMKTAIRFSPDGTRIAAADEAVPLCVWDATSGELIRTLDHPANLFRILWSPDGTRIVGSGFTWVAVWDVQTGNRVFHDPDLGQHLALSWSPSGDRIATAGFETPLRVWDAASGRKLVEASPRDEIWDVTWSPDGRRIAAPGWRNGVIQIWDAGPAPSCSPSRATRDRCGRSGGAPTAGASPPAAPTARSSCGTPPAGRRP